jgi:hypothetical protein
VKGCGCMDRSAPGGACLAQASLSLRAGNARSRLAGRTSGGHRLYAGVWQVGLAAGDRRVVGSGWAGGGQRLALRTARHLQGVRQVGLAAGDGRAVGGGWAGGGQRLALRTARHLPGVQCGGRRRGGGMRVHPWALPCSMDGLHVCTCSSRGPSMPRQCMPQCRPSLMASPQPVQLADAPPGAGAIPAPQLHPLTRAHDPGRPASWLMMRQQVLG